MVRRLLREWGFLLFLMGPVLAAAAGSQGLPAAMHPASSQDLPAPMHPVIAQALRVQDFQVRRFQVTGNRSSFASATVLTGGRSCRVYLSRALPSPNTGGRYGPWRVDWYSCSKGRA